MQRSKERLKFLLIKNRLMSINMVKEELKILKTSSLIRFLMQYILDVLTDIDYSTDLLEIKDIFKILNYVKPESDQHFKIVEEFSSKIIKIIHEKIKLFSEENFEISFLKEIENYINIFIIETKLSLLQVKTDKFPIIADNTLKKIICDLIFKWKNYEYLTIILKHYPQLYNIKIRNKTIVVNLLKEYIKKVKSRSYLARVITLFISSKHFQISLEEKNMLVNLCIEFLNLPNLNQSELFFLKEVLCLLKYDKDFDELNCQEILNKRYNLNNSCGYNELIDNEKFVDMTDRQIITIDSNGTELFDDAFSFRTNENGTYQLGIYITDLTMLKRGSLYDKYALNHFATLYLEDNVISMLPNGIDLRYFSLSKGTHKVIAFTFTFSSKYELLKCEVERALVNINNNFLHNDISNILNDSMQSEYHTLKFLLELSEVISDTYSSIDKYHNIKAIARELGDACSEIPEKYMETPGNRIVSANMIFLNHYIAQYFYNHQLPFIYYNNELDDQKIINGLINKYGQENQTRLMLKSISSLYKPSFYSDINHGHKGLGFDAYSKITSPARMYISLFLQRLINDWFIAKIPREEYLKKYQNLAETAREFTKLNQRNKEYMLEYTKLKKLNRT
ncbi:MAG: RNB domain-containing ribonuclease [Bacilli bacterium]|nr:RNB domain-containing ribonuclease [Bacilli bacterium]